MGYEYREVVCPWCDHRFMWNKTGGGLKLHEYICIDTGEYADKTVCPKCANEMVVLEHVLNGVFKDDKRLKVYGIRGI